MTRFVVGMNHLFADSDSSNAAIGRVVTGTPKLIAQRSVDQHSGPGFSIRAERVDDFKLSTVHGLGR